MRIVLAALNASYVHTNLAIRCIGKALSAAGHEVILLERSLKDRTRELLYALHRADADIYGFSVYIWNREAILSLAADLKQLRPRAKIVLGGPEISYEDDSFFARHPFIDNILAGEGETVFPAYADKLPSPHTVLCGAPYEGFADAGILYDEYPPDSHTGGILYYESSRGCPFACSYCLSSALPGVRAKSAEQTIEELARFESLDGVRVIKLVDRTFNFDRRRADRIWRALAEDRFTKTYHFEICADLLDEENFTVLAAMPAGRIQLECGVQSTNPATLSAIGRTADPRKILTALKRLKQMGNIHIHADLIAGLPLENFARFGQSFDETCVCCHHLQLGFLKLLPGTSLRRKAEEYGIRYSSAPPYEILESSVLSFEELSRLHAIDEVLERFGGGRFPHTLELLLQKEDSPFAFYDAMADALPAVRAMSQRTAFIALRTFALRLGTDAGMLDAALTLDWLLYENGSLPPPLKAEHHESEAEIRRAWCAAHAESVPGGICVIRSALYPGEALLIDRPSHRYEKLKI